ncbi:MAG: amino acid ABC transporter permease [candidate division Zixibacteria bacterium]|nr:amino acid ABC transporter permease [candidate division Zixibacteria bacterium]
MPLQEIFNWIYLQFNILKNILFFLAPAIPMTIKLTLIAFALALLLGLFVGIARLSHKSIIKVLSKIYVDVLRGIPLLVQIFFIYFGLGKILNLDRFLAGVIAIGICYSAYLAEIIRAGIQAIHKGQYQAALSLGMTPYQTMRYVILPQSFRIIIPPVANEFIASLKDSSLVSIIGLRELTRAGREYYSQYFVDFQTWLVVGIIYLVMTLSLSRLVSYLEKKFKVHGYGISH